MMGVEPIQQALTAGAQIVVAGRSSDTSIFAALPLLEGYAPAVVWHMAKILECGAAAVAVRTAPDCMMAVLHEDSFDVFPLREDYHCTPQRRVIDGVGGHEAFILWDVISESQELSRTIATSLSHLAVHNPIPKWHGLISGVAFPYSPPEIDRGPVYEFHLNHVLVPDSPTALFRTEYEEV